MTLVLEVVTESLVAGDHVFPGYTQDDRFDPIWWHNGSAKTPVSYYRLHDGGEEVARVKILPSTHAYTGYTTWKCPAAGATEIDLIEVRVDLRHPLCNKHYGRQAVRAIEEAYGQTVIAMSLDETSDGFWRSLGWTAHAHPEGDRYRLLFTLP